MNNFFIFFIFFISIFYCFRSEKNKKTGDLYDSTTNTQFSFRIEHSLSPRENINWHYRGRLKTIYSRKNRSGNVEFYDNEIFTEKETSDFRKLIENNGLYHIRIIPESYNDKTPIINSIPALSLFCSNWTELIILHADAYGQLQAVTYNTPIIFCDYIPSYIPSIFQLHSRGRLSLSKMGEKPLIVDEPPSIETSKQEPGFFAKYWYYIVPIGIVLLFSLFSAGNEQGAQ